MNKKKALQIVLAISVLINIVSIAFHVINSTDVKNAEAFKEAQEKYPLLSRRILQEYPVDLLVNFLDLRNKLRAQVEPYGKDFGFYFEYLPTGTSVANNANDEFYAASLFKVPVIMAYYHSRERLKLTDDPLLEVKPEHIDKEFGDLWKKGPGTKLLASEAIRLSLIESDNTAIKTIVPYVNDEDFEAVYQALDIDLKTGQDGALVSARTYSSILKALYFSSVLNKDDSQEILDMLTKTKYPDKLAAGVPQHVPVAHKIGNFNAKDGKNEGFRDCGIVYVPRRSYVLCMFSISDEETARERMRKVSKIVYDYVVNEASAKQLNSALDNTSSIR